MTTKLVRRGRDELTFMESRADATPLSAATVRAHMQGLRTQSLAFVRQRGRAAHDFGTMFVTLYMRHADAVLDIPSFRQLVLDLWPDKEDEAYGCMIVARGCTAEQAETHGYWKSLYGIRLAKRLELESFAALEKHDFGVDEDGTPITFASLSTTAVQELATAALPAPVEKEKVGRVVLRLRKRAKELQASKPSYAKLKVKIFASDGEPSVNVTATGREGSEVARKFLAELWK